MVWQDSVLTFIIIIFGYALIPQIYYGFKHKKATMTLQTSAITFSGILVVAFTYYTLELYMSSFINLILASFWLILFIQRIIYD